MQKKTQFGVYITRVNRREEKINKMLARAKELKSINKTEERKIRARMKYILGHLIINAAASRPKLRNFMVDLMLTTVFSWFDRDPVVELMKIFCGDPSSLEFTQPPSNDNEGPTALHNTPPETTGPSTIGSITARADA
ncbi:hypothetical protein MTBLM1_80013 [Rhodospirillaceae bacterium LM-1]|nr:hypothetical protein MTBLM1_80013 [Rhodospirillaceae bacterium LM-1]